jgi:tRNA G18 (ribose-2'-O)-methylase SpoU
MKEHLDPELVKQGDARNVTDEYKNWTVEAIKDDMVSRAFPLHIAIENIQHDFNIGTIVRNANAFNVAGVHIIGKRHWNRRGAMSTEKYLTLYHHKDVEEFAHWVREQGMKLIGVDNISGSTKLQEIELPDGNVVLVFGQEGPGLSKEMLSLCEKVVAIEQFGSTRSVNVGVASGIVMYEWVRRNLN